MTASQQQRPKVFISYSHKDGKWLEQLQVHLKPFERDGTMDCWDDTRIQPGDLWQREIEQALAAAEVAVLLISADFLASDFIHRDELPPLLSAAESRGLVILPVIVRPCSLPESLSKFQAVNPALKPLSKMLDWEQEELWVKVTKAIREALERPSTSQNVEYKGSEHWWNVPQERNHFFTGREDVLADLRRKLGGPPNPPSLGGNGEGSGSPRTRGAGGASATALSGLGGIGKTQTAVEYAYRHYYDQQDYQAVFWVQAETREELVSGFAAIAEKLGLPISQQQDQSLIVAVVKNWLETHCDWLLVLDNADELNLLREFLPKTGKGHILLTTRAQATGRFERVEIKKMSRDEGALFLLRRAKLVAEDDALEAASEADQGLARTIVEELDGLPLALDQAGAFIEETPSSLAEYFNLYQARGAELLAERGELAEDHPSVTITFSLAFEKVLERNPEAADLLRLCAFLAPDSIPEEIFCKGASELGETLGPVAADPLAFAQALREAGRFLLIHRNPTDQTLDIHRLVQEVLRAELDSDTYHFWAERIVRALAKAHPGDEYKDWPLCDRWLPHARAAIKLAETLQREFPQVVSDLLNQTGYYLAQRAQYTEAEPLLAQALELRQRLLGQDHPDVATSLNNLALLYDSQGRYSEAEPLYLQALELRQRLLGQDHPDVATSLNNLALLYDSQGRYSEAEPLYLQALELRQRLLGQDHPSVANSLNNLAALYRAQGRYSEAEPLLAQALELRQRLLGQDHPDVATSLNNLALLYDS
ncbi:FxSxx-COOH system tetratricopeptide repeat protein, partial [Leptolyngbya sp. FACHB-261]|uniref:FxSxx-COOH system tetratricopeptide repeat protein n=1 Tax=Leptolyngbya sp. FACHB-261 TaxID=2692806 RepID=UPI0016880328